MKPILLAAALILISGGTGRTEPPVGGDLHELTLQKCLQLALVHNPDLRTAGEGFLNARGEALRLHAILLPTVSAQGLTTPATLYVQIQETLYNRATLPQLRLSRLDQEQAFLNYRQTLINVIFQIRQAFTTELGAQRLAELDRQQIQDRTAAVKISQQLFDAGKAQRSDLLPLRVLASLAQQNETLAGLTQQQGALALRTLLGVDLPQTTTLRGDLHPGTEAADLDVGKLSSQALRDRQDLKLLENARLSSNQQIEIDLQNAYPIVGFESDSAIEPPTFLPGSLSYDLQRNNDEPQTEREPGDTQLPLSLYFNWIIFDGGNLAGVKASETAKIESQTDAIDELKKAIPGEVASAVASILAERSTLRLIHAETPPEEARRQVELDYQAGRVRLLDKINLETDIVRQQQLQLGSEVRLSLALAALDHALGRGVDLPVSPDRTP